MKLTKTQTLRIFNSQNKIGQSNNGFSKKNDKKMLETRLKLKNFKKPGISRHWDNVL